MVTYFSQLLWWELAKNIGFKEMDKDGNGVLSRDEVEIAARVGVCVCACVVKMSFSLV